MRDGVETGKNTERRKISREKNFTGHRITYEEIQPSSYENQPVGKGR